ncbi:MAG TPA: hypothetical protein VKQ36_01440 [Ktedonobacterales bacterium]|nr:hypothetical protein [Ktedonobacterales bacterium]
MGRWLKRLEEMQRAQQEQAARSTSTASPSTPTDEDALRPVEPFHPELLWRIEAMRPQLCPRPLPQPLLVARPNAPLLRDAPGMCGSCGEPLGEGRRFVCGYCARAKEAVLNAAYEGVPLLLPMASTEPPATPPQPRQPEQQQEAAS